jgi:hypothetical protein
MKPVQFVIGAARTLEITFLQEDGVTLEDFDHLPEGAVTEVKMQVREYIDGPVILTGIGTQVNPSVFEFIDWEDMLTKGTGKYIADVRLMIGTGTGDKPYYSTTFYIEFTKPVTT